MKRSQMLLSLSLIAVALAGCAEEGAGLQGDDEPQSLEDLDLKATEETGVIRGVVVDETITPVPGATVTLESDGREVTAQQDGAFGFSDVEPGVHRLQVDALGYAATQSTVDVEAGVDKPKIVKVLLQKDVSELPYYEQFTFNGFIACSASTPAYRVAVCGALNLVTDLLGQDPLTEDEFLAGFEIDKNPDFIQSEMVWESTQPAGDHLSLVVERESVDGAAIGSVNGVSPLILKADNATIAAAGLDTSGYMQQRVFNFEHPATTPPVPVCDIPNPVHGGTMCLKGVGLTVDQTFEVFTHNFHRFLPQDGWLFIEDGNPQTP